MSEFGRLSCQLEECDGEWCCQRCEYAGRFVYRNCPAVKMRGLGDAVARFAKLLGIRKCRKCCKRQKALNGG